MDTTTATVPHVEAPPNGVGFNVFAVAAPRIKPGDLCDTTCTVDCGHCKGGTR